MKNIFEIIKKRPTKKVVAVCMAVLLVALLAILPTTTAGKGNTGEFKESILSGKAEKGEITSAVIGAGTLAQETSVEIKIPATVKLTDILVSNGDKVKKGDAIASVDRVTVMQTISSVQETMDYIAEKMEEAKDESSTDKVISQISGTVKAVYAQDGDDVQAVMLEHGALAVLSLDGLMAVELTSEKELSTGDEVTVTLKDGTETTGRIASVLDGKVKVTFEDEDYSAGTKATVKDEKDKKIGSGKIYINSQWNATAYSGTVSDVKVSENEAVSSGEALFSLENVSSTAKYDKLAAQHREYEELMLSLFEMYQTEKLSAPEDGVVSGVDKESALLLSSEGEAEIQLLANAPDGKDETVYNNYLATVVSVSENELTAKINPESQSVTDYKNLLSVDFSSEKMTHSAVFGTDIPIYELSGDSWTQTEASALRQGDILLFAGTSASDIVWAVRVIKNNSEEITTAPGGDTASSEPSSSESLTRPSGDMTLPSGGDFTLPDGNEATAPDTGEKPSTSVSGEEATKPSKEDNTTKPSDKGDVTMPSGGEDFTAPSGGDFSKPSTDNDATVPSGEAGVTAPQSGDDVSMPSGEPGFTMPSGDGVTNPSPNEGSADAPVSQPSGNVDFTMPSDTTGSSATPQQGSQSIGQMPESFSSGSFSDGSVAVQGGAVQQEAEFELFDLDGETVLSVTPQNKMSLSVTIDELDITKIEVGQTAQVTLDAFLGEAFEGTITNIGTSGENSGGNSKFSVEISIDKKENMLAGMNATAKIVLSSKSDVITVPVEALCDKGTETVIYTKYNKGDEVLEKPVVVTVGASDGINAEIVSGLTEGQEYYYAYYDTYQSAESGTSALGGLAGMGGFGGMSGMGGFGGMGGSGRPSR